MTTDVATSERRLVILRVLFDQSGFTVSESVLQAALARFGHHVSRDLVRTEFTWLSEQGLITVERSQVFVAQLTPRGADVALGRATQPGVDRPSPQ
jgi:hypothetical protein